MKSQTAVSALFALALGCQTSKAAICTIPDGGTGTDAEASEWISFHTEIPLDAGTDFDALANGLFGTAAQAGQFLTQQSVGQAFTVTSQADPTNPAQVRLTFAYNDGTSTPRTLAVTPASYQIGGLFITTVDAAIAQMQTDASAGKGGGKSFNLAYQVTSTQGGTLSLGINGKQGAFTIVLDISTPHTSLVQGQVGTAASSTGPFNLVTGTVNFTMTADEFDYFVDHAYGQGATSGQNFSDFELVPYLWLRLTVTPDISENIVNVAFAVQTLGGNQVQVAEAPASVMAGNTFQTLVDRQMAVMTAQEAAQPGSSIPWIVPFYYDEPSGGGVVQVIASGAAGVFSVAYTIASPQHPLTDVPFVAYEPVTFPASDGGGAVPCYAQNLPGVTQSLTGVFDITFSASNVIVSGLKPNQQLVGDIGCSIYYSTDVTVTGPNVGAKALENFTVPKANLLSTPAPTYTTQTQLTDGDYQILCAQYVDGNDAHADEGDPVTLPIGGFTVACNVNPVTVQFAILNPSSSD